jgi:hypothetical protein
MSGFVLLCLLQIIANNRFIVMYRHLHDVLFVGSTGEKLLKLLFQVLEGVPVGDSPPYSVFLGHPGISSPVIGCNHKGCV